MVPCFSAGAGRRGQSLDPAQLPRQRLWLADMKSPPIVEPILNTLANWQEGKKRGHILL